MSKRKNVINGHKRSFKINNSGLGQARAHAGTDGHKDKVKVISGTTSQRVIVRSNNNKISLGSNENILIQQKIKLFMQRH